MLTKDLLKYRTRGKSVKPGLVNRDDPALQERARQLLAVFEGCEGMTVGELQAAVGDVALDVRTKGLAKLLMDRVGEEEDDGSVAAARWKWLELAEELRRSGATGDRSAFRGELARRAGAEVTEIQSALYADLPENRKVARYRPLSPAALIDRYNCAQIQGLLLRAAAMRVEVRGASLGEKRALFRQLKFHRLMTEVAPEVRGETLSLELTGPLSLFENTQSYGIRLANFFPWVLHMPEWKLQAELTLGRKRLTLKLDSSHELVSHYPKRTSHVPEELSALLDACQKRASGWQASAGEEFVHLGRQSYCFPDATFRHASTGRRVHLELFHKWHAGQLTHRLEALEKNPKIPLVVGVSRSLGRSREAKEALERSKRFQAEGFFFRDYPTAKAVSKVLEQFEGAGDAGGAEQGGPPRSSKRGERPGKNKTRRA